MHRVGFGEEGCAIRGVALANLRCDERVNANACAQFEQFCPDNRIMPALDPRHQ